MNQPCVHVSPILNPPPSSFLKVHLGEFPGNPMVKTPCFHYQGPCSIPGQRTKIPQAARHSQKAYTMKVTFSINVYNIEPFHYPMCVCVCVCARARVCKSLLSCPTLCDPMDGSSSDSSVHGILQARILEWVAMPSSRGSSQPRDRTRISLSLWRWQAGSLPLVPLGKPLIIQESAQKVLQPNSKYKFPI